MSSKRFLAQQFVESFPQSAARVLEETAPATAAKFIEAVPDKQSSSLIASMLPYHAGKCISHLSAGTAAKYLVSLEARTVAGILRNASRETSDEILDKLPRQFAARVSIVLNYSVSMIGAWVEPTVLTLPLGCTVGEAILRLRDEENAEYHRLYVVDESQHLKGHVSLIRLIRADDEGPIANQIEPLPNVLRANASLDTTLEDPAWLESDYLPVIDRRGKFLGVVRFAALRAAASKPRLADESHDVSGTFMDLAETCYFGLAEVMRASLAQDGSTREIGRP